MKDRTLDKYPGEIPVDSVVVTGYTVNIYHGSNSGWSISSNVQWVIVLATAD